LSSLEATGNSNDKGEGRGLSTVAAKARLGRDDEFWGWPEKNGQWQRQKQIPFGDDNKKHKSDRQQR
jgi:hypothetical protein